VLFKDADANIKVMRNREGSGTANVLWVRIGGSRYAISYDHRTKSVALKDGSVQGRVIARFTNDTTVPEILEVFQRLRDS